MLAGSARIAAIDPRRRNFIDDIGRGDMWNLRSGFPHSIQALEDCEFLLVFDDGNFSENETFLATDWFAHTPKHVLAKNFAVPESAFANIPAAGDIEHSRYIFPGEVPGALVDDIDAVKFPAGTAARMSHRMLAQDPIEVPGGSVRITDSKNFPSASTIAAAWVELQPGALREMHWHPNNDEWQYWISGHARMTVFGSSGKARTFDYYPGDVGYVPAPWATTSSASATNPSRCSNCFAVTISKTCRPISGSDSPHPRWWPPRSTSTMQPSRPCARTSH
jgi:oxalate decarboxylase